MEAGKDLDHAIKTIDDSQWYNSIVGQIPQLDFILRRNPLWNYVPFLATANARITRVAMRQLEERTNGINKRDYNDLLNSFLKAQREHPEALGLKDVFSIVHGAIFAGSDSTASTMQSFFWYLLSHERVHKKLVEEILAADLSDMVTWTEAQNLPYFQACFKEAMRLAPGVGVNIVRKVPDEGANIDSTYLPGGTEVSVNGWVLHRHRGVFGSDAEDYHPERWLEASSEQLRLMERCMFQVWEFRSLHATELFLLTLVCFVVWWRIPYLHRQTPGVARNEQNSTAAPAPI